MMATIGGFALFGQIKMNAWRGPSPKNYSKSLEYVMHPTVGGHHAFLSRGDQLRGSIPHPETEFGGKYACYSMNDIMA